MLIEHIHLMPTDFSFKFEPSYRRFSYLGALLTPFESDMELREDETSK
jgi:hypothetical protein